MHQIFIDGTWAAPAGGGTCEIRNPATLKLISAVADCEAVDVERAIAAAAAARPGWQARLRPERATQVSGLVTEVDAQRAMLAAMLTEETGKPLAESSDCVEWAIERLSRADEASFAVDGRPVVAVLPPADFPLLRCVAVVVGALVDGHCVVIKPPVAQPLTLLELGKAFAKLPPGTVNIVTGRAAIAEALLASPLVCDGHAELTLRGRRDARRLALDPILVCADADLDLATAGVASARLCNGGQTLAASRTVLVEASVARDLADRLHAYVAFLEAGNPAKRETDLGPLLSHDAVRDLEARVGRGAKEGAVLKLGGRAYKPWGLSGHYFQPTVLSQVPPSNSAVREPMRGPVIALTPIADAAEAVEVLSAQNALQGITLYAGASAEAVRAQLPKTCDVDYVTAPRAEWYPYSGRRPGTP
jgi:acyl-CoA reductase-like NAD-dependent aldehyde dehydrogenase